MRAGAASPWSPPRAGYPTRRSPARIAGSRPRAPIDRRDRFDAGVDADGGVAGGRVLAVTGLGDDLAAARAAAYDRLAAISFDGMQVRRDIGWRALGASLTSYAEAGVDIDEGTRAGRR